MKIYYDYFVLLMTDPPYPFLFWLPLVFFYLVILVGSTEGSSPLPEMFMSAHSYGNASMGKEMKVRWLRTIAS